MSSFAAAARPRLGAQEPRVRVEPSWAYTDGPDCAEFSAAYGMTPDPWQRLVLDAWLARTVDDKYACESAGLSVPRQNGKNALLEMRELYGLCIMGEQMLHSAHEVRTTNTAFRRLAQFFEDEDNHPEMHALVKRIRYTNGQEAIELVNGGVIRFCARSKNAARGMTFDVVVFDEAQELTDEQVEAMLPTMAASGLGNRQIIYTGTPPIPTGAGTVFRRTRSVALRGVDQTLAWHEWSVEEPGDIEDRERWYQTNPALGIRLAESFTEKELRTLSADGFARERRGWWSDASIGVLIPAEAWEACGLPRGGAPKPADGDRVAYGVKFSPDGSAVALSACVRPKVGAPHVELVRCEPLSSGVGWLASYIIKRKGTAAAVAVDGLNGSAALLERVSGKVPRRALVTPGTSGVVAAADMFLQAVLDGRVTHYAVDGQARLDQSARNATRRQIGSAGGWGWGGDDPAPIESASLAYWAAMTTKRRPGRGCVVL